MNRTAIKIAVCCAGLTCARRSQVRVESDALAGPIAAPRDRAYPGEIRHCSRCIRCRAAHRARPRALSGTEPRILFCFTLSGCRGSACARGSHRQARGVEDHVKRHAGFLDSRPVENIYAFHVHAPANAKLLSDIDFEYLSPTSPRVAPLEISRDLLMLEWIPSSCIRPDFRSPDSGAEANLTLPADWKFGSAPGGAV